MRDHGRSDDAFERCCPAGRPGHTLRQAGSIELVCDRRESRIEAAKHEIGSFDRDSHVFVSLQFVGENLHRRGGVHRRDPSARHIRPATTDVVQAEELREERIRR